MSHRRNPAPYCAKCGGSCQYDDTGRWIGDGRKPCAPHTQLRMAAEVAFDTLDMAIRQPYGAAFFEAHHQLKAALNRYGK